LTVAKYHYQPNRPKLSSILLEQKMKPGDNELGKFFISYKKILFVENGVSTGNIPSL
jgi:hypothetical protein